MDRKQAVQILGRLATEALAAGMIKDFATALTVNEALYVIAQEPQIPDNGKQLHQQQHGEPSQGDPKQ